jgi:hypothetical protein
VHSIRSPNKNPDGRDLEPRRILGGHMVATTLREVHMESLWTSEEVHREFHMVIQTSDEVHQDTWLSVSNSNDRLHKL